MTTTTTTTGNNIIKLRLTTSSRPEKLATATATAKVPQKTRIRSNNDNIHCREWGGGEGGTCNRNACLRFKSKNSSLFIFDTRRQLRMRMHPVSEVVVCSSVPLFLFSSVPFSLRSSYCLLWEPKSMAASSRMLRRMLLYLHMCEGGARQGGREGRGLGTASCCRQHKTQSCRAVQQQARSSGSTMWRQ